MSTIDVEEAFTQCVRSIGGKLVTEVLENPSMENADYVFESDGVVAELKTLTEEKGQDPAIIKKASQLYDACLKAGEARVVVFGTQKITTDRFPEHFTRQITELYRRPVHERIKKANRQIRQTKQELGRNGDRGLLLLVNDGHTFLDPAHLVGIVNDTLLRYSFRSINTVLVFTVNLPARDPRAGIDFLIWAPISRSAESGCSDEFLEKLRVAWFAHFNALIGHQIPIVDTEDLDFWRRLTNVTRSSDGRLS